MLVTQISGSWYSRDVDLAQITWQRLRCKRLSERFTRTNQPQRVSWTGQFVTLGQSFWIQAVALASFLLPQ